MSDVSKVVTRNLALNQNPSTDNAADPRMMEAAKAFENQFLRFLVSEMRKGSHGGDALIEEGMGEQIFKEELDNSYVDSWVERGGVGLSQMIYDHLMDRYGAQKVLPKGPNEFLKTDGIKKAPTMPKQNPYSDLLSKTDGSLFLAKRLENGFHLKSQKPLGQPVALMAPQSGLVLQAAALDDGRSSIKIQHDEGLVTEIVHSGKNKVAPGARLVAGSTIAELAPARQQELASVLLRLRRVQPSE